HGRGWAGLQCLPPCRRCGSSDDYYSAGLCARCHQYGPKGPESCGDCFAWGRFANRGLCVCCYWWRRKYLERGPCRVCGHDVALKDGVCRLCCKQAAVARRPHKPLAIEDANRFGQQLFFGEMRRSKSPSTPRADRARMEPLTRPRPIRPVAYRQLLLFELPRDLEAARRVGFPAPPDPRVAAVLDQVVTDHAGAHGWGRALIEHVRRSLRILLALQDTPGASIRASEVGALASIGFGGDSVLDVLAAAGLLDDDRIPRLERWFDQQIAGLPEDMARELRVWFDVMRHGSKIPPRSRPRADNTIRAQLWGALPALRIWASERGSLREISRADVLAVLPGSGTPRAVIAQGLRSIFRVLKAHKVVFVNPTARMRSGSPEKRVPLPVDDVTGLREALDSDNPTRAALAALSAFHALRCGQLCDLRLTDVRSGRLHLDGRELPLAAPVRDRLAAYLDYRERRWPHTANPHVFVHYKTAPNTGPVTNWWVNKTLGMSAQAIREDRILDEVRATAGDLRRVCDFFGLSVGGALRYTATVDQPGIVEFEERRARSPSAGS
ncbi:MAG: hypothetical protein ACRDKZ_13190, partial [Actinomycetota bacterium]